MLPYFVVRARWTAFSLLFACSFDGSGLVSAGSPSTTGTTTGDASSTAPPPTTVTPTSAGPDGTASDSASMGTSTTAPVDPTEDTATATSTSTSTDTSTTSTTEPDTTTTSTGPDSTSTSTTTGTSSTTEPDTTTGEMCVDTGMEPNESEGAAIDLGDQGCKAEPKSFSGVLVGDADVDWYRYHGVFGGPGCGNNDPDPKAALVVTADDTLEVCLYADCDNGDAGFNCPNGTMGATSPDGRKGCCGAGSMTYTVNCSGGGNESATLFIRLRNAPADACLEYEVDYSYKN